MKIIGINPPPTPEEIAAFEKFSSNKSPEFKLVFPWAGDLYKYTEITHKVFIDSISELLEALETFIKAAGFSLGDGYLNIFENDNSTKPLVKRPPAVDEGGLE